jgi:sulfotransferase 6B1
MKKTLIGKSRRTVKSTLYGEALRLRHTLRRWGQMARYQRWSLQGVPVLFANSFPKSGTHLLTQVLSGFPQIGPAVNSGLPAIVTFSGDTGRLRPTDEILADLHRLSSGDMAYGHLHATPEIVSQLTQPGVVSYFILRDPRDVVVSHVHYVTEMEPGHIHHRYYTEALHTFDERLRTSILGIPDPAIPFPDIARRFEPFLGWLDSSQVLVLRYEEFIKDQKTVLNRILDHAMAGGFPLMKASWGAAEPPSAQNLSQTRGAPSDDHARRADALETLSACIDPQRSPTFRSGKVGGWKSQFSAENKQLFKEIGGELLVKLGYEKDTDW